MVGRHLRELCAERAVSGPGDAPVRGHAVRLGGSGGVRESLAEHGSLFVEVRVKGKLLRHDERRDEHDVGAAVRGETAGEVEGMLGLASAEQRHDNAAVADCRRSPGEPARTAAKGGKVRPPRHRSWYGTLARMTPGSRSSSRLM